MEDELLKKAEGRVQARVFFYRCAVVFSFIAFALVMISLYHPSGAAWLIPIPVLVMILALIFPSAYGLPTMKGLSDNWEEEQTAQEMNKLRQRKKVQLPPLEDLSETEILELKELERLQDKWDSGEGGYV